jgi:hypothetical protein
MAETKFYEERDFRFEFTPDGGHFKGILVTRAPELEPHTAEVNLSKPRSCGEYAARAHELCGVSKTTGLKVALKALCSRRYEEVAAAREAEQQQEQEGSDPTEEHSEVSDEEIDRLVGRPGVLGRLAEGAAACSRMVGERAMLGLIALVALSAQLDLLPNGKPIGTNVIVSGEAGRGKNYLCDAVARLLPEAFYFAFESSSAKALYYAAHDDPAFLRHRWIYPNEAEGTDLLVEMFRPLLSGGSARHITVNKAASGRNVAQEFTVEGPVTLAVPTVRNKLDTQLPRPPSAFVSWTPRRDVSSSVGSAFMFSASGPPSSVAGRAVDPATFPFAALPHAPGKHLLVRRPCLGQPHSIFLQLYYYMVIHCFNSRLKGGSLLRRRPIPLRLSITGSVFARARVAGLS